jgi:DNA-binding NtrC family response regulator
MKKIVFYSTDFTLSISLMMYLQGLYNITTTSDIDDLISICSSFNCDLLIIDAQPSEMMEKICRDIKGMNPVLPIILTYVYDQKFKDFDYNIRKYVKSIFYKPFDLENVTQELLTLTS